MQEFLVSSEYIDWLDPEVSAQAELLAQGLESKEEIARACFHYVRDEIKHSSDYQLNPVTVRASEVLRHGTGVCYAKSHLLAALLRANHIPAALCYQRLTIENDQPPFCLHGLNAVYLEPYGWYRIDARGNKTGVEAEFCPPKESLAFPIHIKGEADLPELWVEPLDVVVQAMNSATSHSDLAENLPDIELIEGSF